MTSGIEPADIKFLQVKFHSCQANRTTDILVKRHELLLRPIHTSINIRHIKILKNMNFNNNNKKTPGLSPQANYTDRGIVAGQRS
jgi:hypothetical protein